jgi:metallophosphoesterase superfamily enzyme
LTHYPQEKEQIPEHLYCLCGHLHPCVTLQNGSSRNSLKLPCFYFGAYQGTLPAFGEFTGCAAAPVKEGDQVFVLAEGEVICVT